MKHSSQFLFFFVKLVHNFKADEMTTVRVSSEMLPDISICPCMYLAICLPTSCQISIIVCQLILSIITYVKAILERFQVHDDVFFSCVTKVRILISKMYCSPKIKSLNGHGYKDAVSLGLTTGSRLSHTKSQE